MLKSEEVGIVLHPRVICSPQFHVVYDGTQVVHIKVGVHFRWDEDTEILELVGSGIWNLVREDGDLWLSERL